MSKPDEPDFANLLDFSDLIPTTLMPDSTPDQISFIITQAQKANLRALGYDDEVIRLMKPEEAHSLLGLKVKSK